MRRILYWSRHVIGYSEGGSVAKFLTNWSPEFMCLKFPKSLIVCYLFVWVMPEGSWISRVNNAVFFILSRLCIV